jgi:hypothetical protein
MICMYTFFSVIFCILKDPKLSEAIFVMKTSANRHYLPTIRQPQYMQLTFYMFRFLAGCMVLIIESGNIRTSFFSLIIPYTVKHMQDEMNSIKTIYLAHNMDNVKCTPELF